jgi:predicted ATP-grasp superfamily ATP-dependent carboligase
LRHLQQLGEYVQQEVAMKGWLQADFIEDVNGQLWLLEFNPRWTAGMEVLWLSGCNLLGDFMPRRATQTGLSRRCVSKGTDSGACATTNCQAAKAVIYAQREIKLSQSILRDLHALPRCSFADLPAGQSLNTTIPKGAPLLTVRTVLEAEGPAHPHSLLEWQELRYRLLRRLTQLASQVHRLMKSGTR